MPFVEWFARYCKALATVSCGAFMAYILRAVVLFVVREPEARFYYESATVTGCEKGTLAQLSTVCRRSRGGYLQPQRHNTRLNTIAKFSPSLAKYAASRLLFRHHGENLFRELRS